MTGLEWMGLAVAKADKALDLALDGLARLRRPGNVTHFAACGSTALGVEAALRDRGDKAPRVIRAPDEYAEGAHPTGGLSPFVGISMSGRSAEVRETLEQASGEGQETTYVTQGEAMAGASANLILDLDGVPKRLLPLVGCLVAHRSFGSRFPRELGERLALGEVPGLPGLPEALRHAHQMSLMPVFVSSGSRFFGDLLCAQYMEFLKKPALHLSFPQWTHDFLWTLGKKDRRRLQFIQMRPRKDLADGRFHSVIERLDSLGIDQGVLEEFPGLPGEYPNSSNFARVLLLFHDLSKELGVDPEGEISF